MERESERDRGIETMSEKGGRQRERDIEGERDREIKIELSVREK